jgi:hypothetical protein
MTAVFLDCPLSVERRGHDLYLFGQEHEDQVSMSIMMTFHGSRAVAVTVRAYPVVDEVIM